MKQFIRLFAFTLLLTFGMTLSAQVTVGSEVDPEKAALLDIKSQEATTLGGVTSNKGGLLLPRVALENKGSLSPFLNASDADYQNQMKSHTGLMVYNLTNNAGLERGIYVWNGQQWVRSGRGANVDFFYMPSIPIEASAVGAQQPINLYDIYKAQFTNPKVMSQGAPSSIPVFQSAADLYYYITDYDTSVFENITISEDGIMNYEVKSSAGSSSFINIVFVIK